MIRKGKRWMQVLGVYLAAVAIGLGLQACAGFFGGAAKLDTAVEALSVQKQLVEGVTVELIRLNLSGTFPDADLAKVRDLYNKWAAAETAAAKSAAIWKQSQTDLNQKSLETALQALTDVTAAWVQAINIIKPGLIDAVKQKLGAPPAPAPTPAPAKPSSLYPIWPPDKIGDVPLKLLISDGDPGFRHSPKLGREAVVNLDAVIVDGEIVPTPPAYAPRLYGATCKAARARLRNSSLDCAWDQPRGYAPEELDPASNK